MINSYKEITGKYLKVNLKRTVLTILGIVMSVALISAICLFFKALQTSQINFAKNSRGSYHVMFTKVDKSLYENMTNNPKLSTTGLVQLGNKFKMDHNIDGCIITGTKTAFKLLPFKCSKGKLPENKSEIAIQKWMLKYIKSDAAIGDKININNHVYRLSGILTDDAGNQLDSSGTMIVRDDAVSYKNAYLLAEISSNTDMRAELNELQNQYKRNIQPNVYLLSTEGLSDNKGMVGMYAIIIFIIGIVLVATIAVIYNSFQISVVERIKQFGLLRAIGTTPSQIRKIVLREATILSLIGIPIGLLFGVIAIFCITAVINILGISEVLGISAVISPVILIASGIIGLVSIYISAFIPALFAGRISPLEAISSRTSIKKEKIKRGKSFVFSHLLGFEGNMARKNIKRNKNRYRITVFSIIISVSLFITFKSFMDMVVSLDASIMDPNYIHFSVTLDTHVSDNQSLNKVFKDDTVYNKISELNTMKRVYREYPAYPLDSVISNDARTNIIKNMGKIYKNINLKGSSKTFMPSYIKIYDKPSFDELEGQLKEGAINMNDLNKGNGVILVNKNQVYDSKSNKGYVGKIADLKVGDEILLSPPQKVNNKAEEFTNNKAVKVKILGIVNDEPFNSDWQPEGIKLITTKEMVQKLTGIHTINPTSLNIQIKNADNSDIAETQINRIIKDYQSLNLINYIDSAKHSNAAMLMIQILMYGFVIVISLIGVVNIINTVTTNIILRKREFGVIKCIGLTQKSLKKMIAYEGLIYGIMGTLYGSIAGCIFSYIIFIGLNGIREIQWSIPWDSIAIAGVCAIMLGYLSVLSPLSRINKENLIESVRMD